MRTRAFGRTGESIPILSAGCLCLVDEDGCCEGQAVAILNVALERGAVGDRSGCCRTLHASERV